MLKTYLEPEVKLQLFSEIDTVLTSTFTDSDGVNIGAEDLL